MMKKLTLTILITIIVACGRKAPPLSKGFASAHELVQHQLNCIQTNDQKCFDAGLITYQEFKISVYPYLPEAKNAAGGISLEDYWGWTVPDRLKAKKALFTRFGGAPLVKFTIGEPKKNMNLGAIKLHRDIPLYADFRNPEKNTIYSMITTDFFKAVVEVNGQFKLLNMTYE